MELTRRDALAALGALGVGGGAVSGCVAPPSDTQAADVDVDRIRDVSIAAAEVVYPSEVSRVDEFVMTFLEARLEEPTHAAGLDETVAELDDHATAWYDDRFAALSVADRDRVLEEVGAAAADEDPDGTTAERVRYYVVNELLLALYASPAGGELVGIENPQGHAGGLESYQRGPNA